tara:strand:- start:869 stop:1135 length:267 start_codon:yes stop_codon:yes gene_type:complete
LLPLSLIQVLGTDVFERTGGRPEKEIGEAEARWAEASNGINLGVGDGRIGRIEGSRGWWWCNDWVKQGTVDVKDVDLLLFIKRSNRFS